MPKLQYNLNDIPDFVSVEPGKYRAKLRSVVKQASKTSKQPMLVWTWEILTGEPKGQTVKSWTSLQENALFGLKQHLEGLGLSGKVSRSTDSLIGKIAVLVITQREATDGSDRTFANVESVLPKNTPLKSGRDESDDDDDDEDEDEDDRPRRRRRARDDDDDDEEDADDDDDDEDEEERPRSKKKTSKKSKKSRRRRDDDDEDDEDDDD